MIHTRPRAPARLFIVVCVFVATLMAACTGLRPGYEVPTVTVKSLRVLPAREALPDFEVGLRVLNPNPEPLALRGMSFTVSLDGRDLIKGVGNDLPVIEAYGAGDFRLVASANVLAGVRFISDLLTRGPRDTLRYELEAKLDTGAFRPSIRVRDAGEISLTSAATASGDIAD